MIKTNVILPQKNMTLADLVYPVKALAILAPKSIQIIWCSNCFTLNASDEDYCKQRVMRTNLDFYLLFTITGSIPL